MSESRKAGDIVCQGDRRKPHVLARVTFEDGRAPDLTVTPGVQWFAAESTGGASITFTCKHGVAVVDLLDFAREMRSTRRRARRTVNAHR